MPNLPAHIDLAFQAAQLLGHPALETHMGYFLLGSTSPDMRVITRGRRDDYHFAPLDFETIGAGVEGMFGTHPELESSWEQDGPTRAFVAGYVTHLVADERWIVDMYRPYFGNPDVFEDDALGKVMDRVFQLELDRQGWKTVETNVTLLEAATDGIELGFIPSDTIGDWRRWVVAFIARGFSWDRIKFMARRIAEGDDSHPAHRVAEEFVQAMPDSLERLYQTIPHRNLAEYREQTVQALAEYVGDYLQ